MHEALKASIIDLKKWMPWAQSLASLEDTQSFIRESIRDWEAPFKEYSERTLVIMDLYNKQFIGSMGVKPLNLLIPSFEVGYWIDKRLSGQGLMTEAVNGVVRYLWGAHFARRIEIRCEVDNIKSAQVAKRLNFPREAQMINERISADGKSVVDTLLYAIGDDRYLPTLEVTWD
jgi:RimJ/RimL family protein N-acetyltransferase